MAAVRRKRPVSDLRWRRHTRSRREPTVPGPNDVPGRLRLPDSPKEADHAFNPERLPADRRGHAEPWSRAELRERLERLPPGHPSAVRADAPERDQDPDGHPDAAERNYWSEVPRFQRAWADHLRTWPPERLTSADPARNLSPEQLTKVKEEVGRIRETASRLTEQVRTAERDNSSGARLEGLQHCLKGDARLHEKIGELAKRLPTKAVEDIVREFPDAIRYTFCSEPSNYAASYWDVKHHMEQQGHVMIYSKNHWRDDLEYKGINTRWVTPEGQRFEVQFHTVESYHAKQEVTHRCYERLRSPLTQSNERRELQSLQREVCRWIGVPDDTMAIPDHNRKART
jgi:hypothetical protein